MNQSKKWITVIILTKTPLQSARETCAPPPSQAGILDGLNEPCVSFEDYIFCLVPVPSSESALYAMIVLAKEIGEDTILIFESAIMPDWSV